MSFELSSSNASWKYPCTASNFAKYLAVTGIACNISLVDGNGWTGRLTMLFSTNLNAKEEGYLPSLLGLVRFVLCSQVLVTCEEVAEARARRTREAPMCVVAQR